MGKILCVLVFCFLLLSFQITIDRTFAQSPVMQVEPASIIDVAVGQSFNVSLTVSDVTALFAWQILLLYNPTVLECTGAVFPTEGGIFAGKSVIPVTAVINNEEGSVMFGASLIGSDSVTGSGIMCQITFKVNAVGTSDLNFSTPYGTDTFLLDGDLNVIVTSTENGSFSNGVTPPPERHDIAITNVSFSDNNPAQGDSVEIIVVAQNNGTVAESTFDVEVSNGTTPIGTQTVTNLVAGANTTLTFSWNTTGTPTGQNTISANATSVPGETDLSNNVKTGTVNVQPIRHDITIISLSFSNNSPKQNDTIVITVAVKNNGTATEDTFDVQVSNGTTLIGTQTVSSLGVGATKNVTYSWNTTGAPLGQNNITANATAVPGETDLGNNVKTGTVTLRSSTTKSADINSDSRFDMKDIAIVCWSFDTEPGDARWNENVDLTGPQDAPDGRVDMMDIAVVVSHFWNKP